MTLQPEDEMRAPVGEGGNGEFVMAWFGAILGDHNWTVAMQCMSDDLRRAHAMAWADEAQEVRELLGPELDDVIASLAEINLSHALWEAFAKENIRWYVEAFGDLADHLAIGTGPGPVAPDLEGFALVDHRQLNGPEIEVDGEPIPAAVDVIVRMTTLGPRIESWSPGPAFPRT